MSNNPANRECFLKVMNSNVTKMFAQCYKKKKILSLITHPHVVRLWNTNEQIFAEIRELSIDSNGTTTIKVQKGSKGIHKIVHVTSVVQPKCC